MLLCSAGQALSSCCTWARVPLLKLLLQHFAGRDIDLDGEDAHGMRPPVLTAAVGQHGAPG